MFIIGMVQEYRFTTLLGDYCIQLAYVQRDNADIVFMMHFFMTWYIKRVKDMRPASSQFTSLKIEIFQKKAHDNF